MNFYPILIPCISICKKSRKDAVIFSGNELHMCINCPKIFNLGSTNKEEDLSFVFFFCLDLFVTLQLTDRTHGICLLIFVNFSGPICDVNC